MSEHSRRRNVQRAGAIGLQQIKAAAVKGDLAKYITGSAETTKHIQDEGDDVGMCTRPERWEMIVHLLEVPYPGLAQRVVAALGAPTPLFGDTDANVLIRELVLDAQFTREEKMLIRDAYCFVVPGVTTVIMNE